MTISNAMSSRQPKLRPKSHIAGFSDSLCNLPTMLSLSQFESRVVLNDEKNDQRIFRVKRKHVFKACDRCRIKKTKCDGKQPCNRCSSYNHPCLFREKKATQTKVYSRGFVEMLESHHSLVVKALQRVYKLCADKEGFPGEPLAETSDGYPLTHAILDRLGLIKQAENTSQAADEESEDLQYLRLLSNSTDCSATADPSPEPATPPDPAPNSFSPVQLSPEGHGPVKWQFQTESYQGYPRTNYRMSLPHPDLGTCMLANDSECPTTAPSPVGAGLANPYLYYTDGGCNPESTDNNLQAIGAEGSSAIPTAIPAGLPVGMAENYNLTMPDHQPIYPTPLTPAWVYPCE